MTTRTYASPDAFKQAVEQRLRTGATGPRLRRSRQLLVFERFLARIVTVFGDAATLKGGLALELRTKEARATKDVDLRVMGSAQELLAKLQAAGRFDLGDLWRAACALWHDRAHNQAEPARELNRGGGARP